MTTTKKSVLTKGIIDLNLRHGRFESDDEDAFERVVKALSNCPYDELVALRQATPGEIYKTLMSMGVDTETAREAIAIIKGDGYASVLASVFSPKAGTENMTNLRSPGAPEGKIGVEPGKSGSNVSARRGDRAFVSGDKNGRQTGDYLYSYENPSSAGNGYPVEIGRERYTETRSTAGTSEDTTPIRTRYREPSVEVRGETNPNFAVRQGGHGGTGTYGRPTSLVTRTDEAVPREGSYTAVKSQRRRDLEKAAFQQKISGPSQEQIDDIVRAQERREGYHDFEEVPLEVLKRTREVAARHAQTDPRWVQTVAEIDQQILQKKVGKLFRK